jgi:hypothetical protein
MKLFFMHARRKVEDGDIQMAERLKFYFSTAGTENSSAAFQQHVIKLHATLVPAGNSS